jgi:hypothetical protein
MGVWMRNSFGVINKARVGSKSTEWLEWKFLCQSWCEKRQDVIGATEMYFSSINDPQYLVSAHYFIYKDKGKAQTPFRSKNG